MATPPNPPLADALPPAVPPLDQLYVYLTAGCNLACRHCWLAPKFDPDGTRQPTLPLHLFEHVLDEALPLGLTSVKLTGGEPLLHPQFLRFLEIVEAHELGLTIESNGLRLTADHAAAIARSPQPSVAISLDGVDAATHDAVRGVVGSFTAAVAAVGHLVAAGMQPQIIMSLMRSNVDQAEAMVRLAERLGAGSVKFNVIQPTARGAGLYETDRAIGVAELIALGQHVELEVARTTELPLHFDMPPAFRPLSSIARGTGCGVCHIFGIIGVLPTGHLALCGVGEHIPELVFGRVGSDALVDIWRDHPVLRELRQGLPGRLTGVCADCLMRHRCLGSCIAQNFYKSKDLFAPFWLCEQAQNEGIFPGSRLGARHGREHRAGTPKVEATT